MDAIEAAHSLEALEYRLYRLEHYLTGNITPASGFTPSKEQTVHARVARLERGLESLASRSSTIRQLIQLQSAHPDLFHPSNRSASTLSPKEQLAVINASAPAFQETSSRLTTLQDLPIPPTTASMQLISLRPRIEKVQRQQRQQKEEMRRLRARSAKVIEQWYELGVLGIGACWAEWEERVEDVEKQVRRREKDRENEEKEDQAYQT